MYIQLIVIQSTSWCNINCRYCYLPQRDLRKRISQETLEQIFRELFASPFVGGEVLFAWHAGEPLALPINFYEQAFRLQERWNRQGVRVINAFQTNATLITRKWCQFFQAHNIQVGVSLDGPARFHDAQRVDRAGRGTFQRTMRGLELLRTHNIPYTIISVVTDVSVRQPDLFWQFFAELRPLRLGLNPEEVEGVNTTSSLGTPEDIEHYKAFIRRLLVLSEQDECPVKVREIENLLNLIYTPEQFKYAQTNIPMAIISFDCDGNFSTFSPELLTVSHPKYGDFRFGNIFTDRLEDIFTNPKFQRIEREIRRGVRQCEQTCAYFPVCGGGSPSNKLHENGTFHSTETMACRLQIKVPTDALLEHLEAKYHLSSPAQPLPVAPVKEER